MQVFGFHVYNLYSFPSILNGNVNKCYELVSSEIFCLFPLQHDNSLICKMCKLCEMFSLIFVSLMRTPSTFIFQRIKLKTVYSVCGICRIVTLVGATPFHSTVLLYGSPLIKLMLPLRADSFWN